jgi:hypothetical protein
MASAHHEAGHCVIAGGLGVAVVAIALDSIRTLVRRDDPMASWAGAVIALRTRGRAIATPLRPDDQAGDRHALDLDGDLNDLWR